MTALADQPASAHWVSSPLLETKILLCTLCSCADSGVWQHSHTYWNLCMSVVAMRLLEFYLRATNLTNFIPFGVWWLLQSRHVDQSVRKSCGEQMSAFPLVPYVTLSPRAESSCCMVTWSIGGVGISWCPLPGLTHIFQLQQYIPFPKNTGKCICPLFRNSWVCLYSWVHVWRWGIELFTACLTPWWLNWDLLLYLLGMRGSRGWGRGKV